MTRIDKETKEKAEIHVVVVGALMGFWPVSALLNSELLRSKTKVYISTWQLGASMVAWLLNHPLSPP